jgi:hypothetical protein
MLFRNGAQLLTSPESPPSVPRPSCSGRTTASSEQQSGSDPPGASERPRRCITSPSLVQWRDTLAERDRLSFHTACIAPAHRSVDQRTYPGVSRRKEIGAPDKSPLHALREPRSSEYPFEMLRFRSERRFADVDEGMLIRDHGFAIGDQWRHFVIICHVRRSLHACGTRPLISGRRSSRRTA